MTFDQYPSFFAQKKNYLFKEYPEYFAEKKTKKLDKTGNNIVSKSQQITKIWRFSWISLSSEVCSQGWILKVVRPWLLNQRI
jgi:hypothetical protein